MKLRGALADKRPWSPSEDALLRTAYPAGCIDAVRDALPDRSTAALYHRARQLVLSRRRRWTPAEDRRLRNRWEDGRSVEGIAAELGRSPVTIFWRATVKLGLPAGVPPGYEYLSHAAKRTGFAPKQLVRILRWHGVRLRRVLYRPTKASFHRHFVDPCDVDDAVAAWLKTEPAEAAARRLGIDGDRFRARLRAVGVQFPGGKRHVRVSEADVARANAIAQWSKRNRKAA